MSLENPTHIIENLTNSPYPMYMKDGYLHIIPAFSSVEGTPTDEELAELNEEFWRVTPLVSDADKAAADKEAADKAAADKAAANKTKKAE